MMDALRESSRRIGNPADDAERTRLRETHVQLTQRLDELVARRLKDVPDSESMRSALAKLETITGELVSEARR